MKLIVGFYQLPPLQKSNCGVSVTRIYFVHAWKSIEIVILSHEYTRIRKVWLVFENSQVQANLQQALSGCPGWINRKQLRCNPDSPCSVPETHDARLELPPESSLCSLPVLACTHTYAWYFKLPPSPCFNFKYLCMQMVAFPGRSFQIKCEDGRQQREMCASSHHWRLQSARTHIHAQ